MENRGFTLVELLISTTIFLVVIGFGLASWSTFRQRATLGTVVDELASQLILIRSRALNGYRPNDSDCQRFEGYRIDTDLSVAPYCYQDGTVDVFKPETYGESLAVSDSITVKMDGFPLVFESLSGSANEASIILTSNDQSGRIDISQLGEITTTFPYSE